MVRSCQLYAFLFCCQSAHPSNSISHRKYGSYSHLPSRSVQKYGELYCYILQGSHIIYVKVIMQTPYSSITELKEVLYDIRVH